MKLKKINKKIIAPIIPAIIVIMASLWQNFGIGTMMFVLIPSLIIFFFFTSFPAEILFDLGAEADEKSTFNRAFLSLVAAFALHNQRDFEQEEHDMIRDFIKKSVHANRFSLYWKYFVGEYKKKNIDVEAVCKTMNNFNHRTRLQLLYQLFKYAASDKRYTTREMDWLWRVASYLQISSTNYYRIKAMFDAEDEAQQQEYAKNKQQSNSTYSYTNHKLSRAYKILGLSPSVSNEAIKQEYRKLALENHPDKVAYLGEAVRLQAESKFQSISEAYEQVKESRNMK